jgi:hypothetical protein
MSSLPELESKFDQVLEQLLVLMREVEHGRWDAGVVVMVKDGQLDIRGMGTTDTEAAAFAILFMAAKTLPPVDMKQLQVEAQRIMERSQRIEMESQFWRPGDAILASL